MLKVFPESCPQCHQFDKTWPRSEADTVRLYEAWRSQSSDCIVLEFPIEISDESGSDDAVNDEDEDDDGDGTSMAMDGDDDEEDDADTTHTLTIEDIIDIMIRLLLKLKRQLSENEHFPSYSMQRDLETIASYLLAYISERLV